MDETQAKAIEKLRALGVKSASWNQHGGLTSVELFPASPLAQFEAVELGSVAPETSDAEAGSGVPPAIARILRQGSVS